MTEKGINAEDVKNIPPIEEIHGLNIPPAKATYDLNSLFIEEPPDPDIPTQVVKVNSLYRYDKAEVPPTKFLVSAWMSLITLCLSKTTTMLILVDN